MKKLLALILVANIAAVNAAEPLEIKGIRLGMTLQAVEALYPTISGGCRLQSSEAGLTRCLYAPYRSKQHANAGTARIDGLETFGGKQITYLGFAHRNGVISNVMVAMDTVNYAAIKAALIAKYGQPKRTTPGTVTNRAGAAFETETSQWSQGDAHIFMVMRSSQIDRMSVTLTSDADRAEDEAAKAADAKVRKSDL